jgi:hypothetical protein
MARKTFLWLPIGPKTTFTKISEGAATAKPIAELGETGVSIVTMVISSIMQYKIAQKQLHTPTAFVERER